MSVNEIARPESQAQAQPISKSRKAMLRGLVAVAIAASAGVSAAVPVAAYSFNGSGQPGGVVVPVVQGTHLPLGGIYYPTLMTQGMVVDRSLAAAGAQNIAAAYRVFRWNGASWVYSTGSTASATIAAGATKTTMPIWTVYPTDGTGYYYVETTVTWRTAAGTLLGTINIFWTGPRDYQCVTFVRPCTPGTGWIYLG
jgi:hypothetical protein